MNNMTYLNFLWKMANVEGAFVEDARCGRRPCGRCPCGRWHLWKMANVEGALWKVAVEDGVYSASINEQIILNRITFNHFRTRV